ncbi:MAG: T9SS type A sorting domain-containing protein [Candidatus Cloacimonetes bacterium]|nr:T9SS type A sorting domain-containing protein [Candidatus Cloacimonadota bacterium]MCF7813129.1 T9SS type A sorting domain-containing protein [Candidatus Cloacimonadota bacterium]MCF7867577.1 T9SS type A sorting domain-containing protein [Candidatus Cloacimonadota bacterium]MCF7883029.1 T9SS type A sorting domain-containing protein [Candidatus Cloacimonadota bacterium]
MKYKLFLLLALICVNSWLHSTIWEIKQDGTGNFTAIQAGIDFCADGDTLLVYPGTYCENLLIEEKHLTIGSLYLTTGDEQYISQTVLDGFQNGSVFIIESVQSGEVFICGFIIQNGIGSGGYPHDRGGGIHGDESIIRLKKNIIQNNTARIGGGINLFVDVELTLEGNTIRYNSAATIVGGISCGYNSNVIYDTEMLNSLYLNYAGCANDILVGQYSPFQEIILDTFTVAEPAEGYYFIYPSSGGAGVPQPGTFSFSCQHSVLEQVDHDLYISPEGDDNNSGISAEEPLQTIAYALAKIHSDSTMQKTIHIADGTYSVSQNNQIFPLHLKSYVDLVGESMENTILDTEFNGGHLYGMDPQYRYQIENFTFINPKNQGYIHITQNTEAKFKNIHFLNDDQYSYTGNSINASFSDIYIENIQVNDIQNGTPGIYLYTAKNNPVFNVVNYRYINNDSDSFNRALRVYRTTVNMDSLVVNVINSEITNNSEESFEWLPNEVAILIDWQTKLNLVNCTIGDNSTLHMGSAIQLADQSEANIVNSILYGDVFSEICLNGTFGPCTLNARNSLIEGGESGIVQMGGTNNINWDYTTMLSNNPLWLGSGHEWPYALFEYSPCIDAGTLDLPYGVVLPQYDLAGNPRIYGDTIDIGAYEWQGTGIEEPTVPNSSLLTTNLSNYPNPFNPSTTIKLELVESGKIELAIYNIKGQKVKTLLDCTTVPGTYECNWNGKDEMGKSVSSGQYIVKLQQNRKETAKKIMMLK